MRVAKYLLMTTAILLASYGAVSTTTDSQHSTLSATDTHHIVKMMDDALLEKVGTRFLRSSKTETKDDDDDDLDAANEERGAEALGRLASKFSTQFKGYTNFPAQLKKAMAEQPVTTQLISKMMSKGKSKEQITALIQGVKGGNATPENKKKIINLFNGIWLQAHKGGI
ncbi:hypothetical protein PHYBOEH_009959 [Phytophthora boehmeriae]|uniref:RxLR effector protein n=1 Tax=Phytophthora boehmeriae TaxID=109152 RepID=A0A8T1VV06_9STRA|nr:hypothetical protein PHYBOEH_009959 [Phytophthora boehmeriae]